MMIPEIKEDPVIYTMLEQARDSLIKQIRKEKGISDETPLNEE